LNQKRIRQRWQATQNAQFTISEFGTIPALGNRARWMSCKSAERARTETLERWNAERQARWRDKRSKT
jgi:hypothetical protein